MPCVVPGITTTRMPTPTPTPTPTTQVPIIPDPGVTTTTQPQPQPRGPDLQLRLAHAIFSGYFEEDRDLSDRGFLAEVGAAVTGYSAAEILRICLSEDEEGDEEEEGTTEKMKDENGEGGGDGSEGGGGPWTRTVDALEADVRARGIDAVPTIIIQDRYLAGGWQEARLLVELFESIRNGSGGGGRETSSSPGGLKSGGPPAGAASST